MTPVPCSLCSQLEGSADGDLLYELLGGHEYVRRVVDLSGELALVPSAGALVRGHLLLIPRRHVRSFAALGRAALEHVERTLTQIEAAMPPQSAALQVFEHGDAPDSERVSCSVEHAHLHLVPGVPDLWPGIAYGLSWEPAAALADVTRTGGREYLALRTPSAGWQIALAPPAGHPSQILRRAVAEAIGEPTAWNWRNHPRRELTEASWELARALARR